MLNLKPLDARRFSGFYSNSRSLGFLGRNAPPKQKQGLPLLSLPILPEREPREPPAVVSARRVGDTAHVSSVSAQHSWLRTEGLGGGRERPSGRVRSPAGREAPRQKPDLRVCCPAPPTQESPPLPRAPSPASCTRRPDLLEFQHKGNPRPQEVHHEERGIGGGERGMLPSRSTPPPSRSPGQP